MPLPDSDGVSAESAPYPKEQTFLSPQRLADVEHPWLGLESFREETRAYFFGRDAEISELRLRLRSDPLLVLYGRSGLGKTSILLAGLIPRLREEGQRPLFLRLRYEESAQDVCGQLASAIFGWGDSQSRSIHLKPSPTKSLPWLQRLSEKLGLSLPRDPESQLWLRLHYRDEPPDITHLILDQFEEIFTLGARQPSAEEKARDMLAILLQGAVPEPIRRLISEHDTFSDHFDPDSVPVRVILALRNDYVYALNRWRRHLPALGQNSFELRALRGPAAFKAVFNPGELRCHYRSEVNEENKVETGLPPIITEETAQRIVHFVAQTGEEVPVGEIEAVPPILSLLCRELNERRFTKPAGTPEAPAAQITFRESDADIETIIAAFYERCLTGCPEAIRIFIEEELVSYSGARIAQDEESILRVFTEGCEDPGAAEARHAVGFGDATAARDCLELLVNQRLLSSLGGNENPSYELVHDLLATVVKSHRIARKERREASAREAAERAAALKAAKERAVASKKAADELINFMQYDLSEKLGKLGRLDVMDAINARIIKYHEEHPPEPEDETARDTADRERSVALNQQGDILRDKGQLAEALKAYRDSLEIAQRLTKKDPANMRWQRDLSESYNRVGDVQRDQGDLAGALKSYRNGLAIRERLAAQDPSNAGWQGDLAVSLDKLGEVQSTQHDLAGALKSYRDGLAIREKLAQQNPADAGWQRDLAVAHGKVGDVLQLQGKLSEALVAFRKYLAIMEGLAEQDPSNAGWQWELAVARGRVGIMLQAQGRLEAAREACEGVLAISRRLAEQDPSNATWQRGLAVAYGRLGDVLQAQGELSEALAASEKCLAMMEGLAEQDPSNAGWQYDLAVAHSKVGDVLQAQGKLSEALEAYQQHLAITKQLSEQDKSNTNRQRDLIISLCEVARVTAKIGGNDNVAKAQGFLRTAVTLTERYPSTDRQDLLDSLNLTLQDLGIGEREIPGGQGQDRTGGRG
jgi:tetratricopeptide (TPR) repeat protein